MFGWSVVLLATVELLQAGCSNDQQLACSRRVDDGCDAGGCLLTWNDAELKAAFCLSSSVMPPTVVDCGRYHVVYVYNPPAGETETLYFYDISSGSLAAVEAIGSVMTSSGSSKSCVAGPAAGFLEPTCAGASSERLCTDVGDAGAPGDGAAAD